jgi:hypothetical protein
MPQRHAIRLSDRARLAVLSAPEELACFLRKQLFALADDPVQLSEPLDEVTAPFGQAFRFRYPSPEPRGTFFTFTFQYDASESIIEVMDIHSVAI